MPRFRKLLYAAILLVWIALSVGIVWAARADSLAAGLRRLTEHPWSVVTLMDLGAGLLLVAAWIAYRERRWYRILPWWVLLCGMGNWTSLLYVLQARDLWRSPPAGNRSGS